MSRGFLSGFRKCILSNISNGGGLSDAHIADHQDWAFPPVKLECLIIRDKILIILMGLFCSLAYQAIYFTPESLFFVFEDLNGGDVTEQKSRFISRTINYALSVSVLLRPRRNESCRVLLGLTGLILYTSNEFS